MPVVGKKDMFARASVRPGNPIGDRAKPVDGPMYCVVIDGDSVGGIPNTTRPATRKKHQVD
jgi:hypothetical protein